MNTTHLFSILIANYNNGRYLQEAIDSIFAQTYSNWEVIIVDDKSTDNSQQIYDRYVGDTRFHFYYNEENKGCGYTKKRCAELANGEFCGFLDPDDVLLPNALEVSVFALEHNPEASLTMSRYYICNDCMEILQKSRLLQLPPNESYLEHMDYLPEQFASFRKASYLASGGINQLCFAGVDQDLYFHLEEQGKIVVIDEFTYKYRLCNDSVSHGKNAFRASYWNTIARYEACIRRGIPSEKYAAEIIRKKDQELNDKLTEIDRIHASYAYRLGKILLKPFSWLKILENNISKYLTNNHR